MALMPFDEEERLLSAAYILEPLSEEELEGLARRNPDTRLERGEIFFTPQERGEKLFILKEGRIQIYKTNPQGQEITVVVIEEGMIFGEMALTAQQLREAYARAIEPSIVVSLEREDLENLILRNPRVGLRLIERLSERLRLCESRLEDISFKEVPARLANLILQLIESEGVVTGEGYKIPTHYTHEQLGTMISANRVTVTRALGKLEEAGAIELKHRLIYVKDMEALERAAREKRSTR
jgi:CRP/FNR family transcriptional regulator